MKNSIQKAFISFGFWTAISRVFGFIRDILLAAAFGAGPVSDAFFVAFKLPNMFRRLVAEGALVQSFIPTFSYVDKTFSKFSSQEFSSYVQSIVLVFIFSFLVLAEIFMGYLIMGLAPGFISNLETFNTAKDFARITIMYLPMISVLAIWGAVLQASGKFMPSAFSPIILNLSLILASAFILFFKSSFYIIAFAVPLAGILQLLFLFYWLSKERRVPKIVLPSKQTKSYGIWQKFLPAAMGAGVLQINLLVDTILASLAGSSAVSYLYYSDRIAQLPLGIIGVALGTALLPSLSKLETEKKDTLVKHHLEKSFVLGCIFSIPASIAFLIIPEILIEAIFARGAFIESHVKNVALALTAYGLGVPAFIGIKVFQSSFFAMRDTSTPFKISLFSVALNVILSVVLMRNFGFFGIALATSITSYFTLSIYYFLLIKIDRVSFNVLKQFLKLILLGLVFAFVLFQIPSFFVKLNIILSLILIIFISVLFWFTLMILFKFIDFVSIKKALTF